MASIAKRLVFTSCRCPRRILPRYTASSAAPWRRPFSSTVSRFKDPELDPNDRGEELDWDELVKDIKKLDSASLRNYKDIDAGEEVEEWDEEELDVDHEERGERVKIGFWGEGEEELGPDEDYYGDDLTSLGHGELEQHRELRDYARLAAWELPLLSKLAKPFEPPTQATPLRFRYTSYMGEQHPAAYKVVVEFSPLDMPELTQPQKDKLIKLAGPRYNPEKQQVKMSCELYESIAQNKRHLGEIVKDLLAEAKNGKETFADVPFDFRHHKPKVRHEYPQEWLLTPERKKYLEDKRKQQLLLDQAKEQEGTLLDGDFIVDTAMTNNFSSPEPVMVPAGKGRRQTLR